MEVNKTRNCLVTDILLNIRKSSEFENGKLFNSVGVVKRAYFQKKWSIPLKESYYLKNLFFQYKRTFSAMERFCGY